MGFKQQEEENRYLLSETKGRSGWDHHPYTHHVHREGATAKKPAWLQTMAVSRPNARAHMHTYKYVKTVVRRERLHLAQPSE